MPTFKVTRKARKRAMKTKHAKRQKLTQQAKGRKTVKGNNGMDFSA